MPGSIPGFDISSEPAAATWPRGPATGSGFFRILRSGAGLAGVVLMCGLLVVALLAGRIAPSDPFASVGPALSAPTRGHPMGTDDLGRDLLSGVAHGTRTSLVLALVVSILTGLIGVIVGALAGWEGGRLDGALMRLTEFVQVVPRFFLAVIVLALFGAGLDRLALVLALTSWPWIARVVRAEVLSLKQREFVEAARSLGAGRARVLRGLVDRGWAVLPGPRRSGRRQPGLSGQQRAALSAGGVVDGGVPRRGDRPRGPGLEPVR